MVVADLDRAGGPDDVDTRSVRAGPTSSGRCSDPRRAAPAVAGPPASVSV